MDIEQYLLTHKVFVLYRIQKIGLLYFFNSDKFIDGLGNHPK